MNMLYFILAAALIWFSGFFVGLSMEIELVLYELDKVVNKVQVSDLYPKREDDGPDSN